ncbi:MAG: hypothetical protein HY803_07060 [candidate division NC10 bacterium]|nr:hypothetical protein [candidate division NC10 bacterium]
MENDATQPLPKKFWPRFGMLAVELGYVSIQQVREAMGEQVDDDFANRPHRLLGDILVQKGWLTPREVNVVLKELFERTRE